MRRDLDEQEGRIGAQCTPGTFRCSHGLLVACLVVLFFTWQAEPALAQHRAVTTDYRPRAGDVIFHTSSSSQSQAIQDATESRLTHVGLVFMHDGRWTVIEAVQPVRWTALDEWTARGQEEFLVMRATPSIASTPDWSVALREAAVRFLGRDYDLAFQWGDERMYCSELVYLAFLNGLGVELVAAETFGDLELQVASVQSLITRRAVNGILPEERIVTPVRLTRSALLVPVFSNYDGFPAEWGPFGWL
jgi:hypothetical protein